MEIVHCGKGHFYDKSLGECPICAAEKNKENLVLSGIPQPVEPINLPTPLNLPAFDPTVGWLVCVEGHDRGRDYRLHTGNNRVGRNPHNDIHIQGDNTVSAESNCSIAFDPASGCYYVVPGDGKNIVYLNEKFIFNPAELHAYDTITVGSTKLLFVPLCGEHFSWKSSDENGNHSREGAQEYNKIDMQKMVHNSLISGKQLCEALKQLRQQIADANGIPFKSSPCDYKGTCPGVCPACDEEARSLSESIAEKRRNGEKACLENTAEDLKGIVYGGVTTELNRENKV